MNRYEADVLRELLGHPFQSQRDLAEATGHSLGAVNRAVRSLMAAGLLDQSMQLMPQAADLRQESRPKQAVILAAGMGMRMVPINTMVPKALLTVHGETLIERQIRQLHQTGIHRITVVVGFMKERFEYLIDQYGVKLAVNPSYAVKNNLASLALAEEDLSDAYIIPCDLWCRENPFCAHELYSWYMVSTRLSARSDVRVNRRGELVKRAEGQQGNAMLGIAYLTGEDARRIGRRVREMAACGAYDDCFWESALYQGKKMEIPARTMPEDAVVEINTYEQLRELDDGSASLKSEALDIIAQTFSIPVSEIKEICLLKKGMTNRSFRFSVHGERYIMRIPGEGTEQLINRREEAAVYRAIEGLGLCDAPVYLNPENGYKITRYLENVKPADKDSMEEVQKCMAKLRELHGRALQVPHCFDLYAQVSYYEALWNGKGSMYRDYKRTKENVFRLKEYIDRQEKTWCLTHIDAVPDNFLFYERGGEEGLQLTDWEYAGMQDPHVDIAMFCIYALYDKEMVDRVIDVYFEGHCPRAVRIKIYCYIAVCGLLWSNWCEYKSQLGVEFGEYSLLQYRYAKEYYRYASQAMEKDKEGIR